MAVYLFGLLLFFAVHSISIVNEPWRDRMAARLGEAGWQGLYSLVSLAGFVLIVWGYGTLQSTPALIYSPPIWLRHVAVLLMLPVFPLLLATYLPGYIKRTTQHPMLIATMLWSAAHLLANGTAADLLLFGTFLAWAIADRISMSRRQQRPLHMLPNCRLNDLFAIVGGLALYAAFLLKLHVWLFRVSPLG